MGALKASSDDSDFPFCHSRAQRNSFRLLYEYWHNQAYDSRDTKLIIDWIEQASNVEIDIRVRPRISGSRYNLTFFTLWRAEFGYANAPSELQLYSDRQMAAAEAACHRITKHVISKVLNPEGTGCDEGLSTFDSIIGESTRGFDSGGLMSAGIDPCSWIPDDDGKSVLPYYLWDRTSQCTVIAEDL